MDPYKSHVNRKNLVSARLVSQNAMGAMLHSSPSQSRYERLSRSSFDWLSSLPFFIAYEARFFFSGSLQLERQGDKTGFSIRGLIQSIKSYGNIRYIASICLKWRFHGDFMEASNMKQHKATIRMLNKIFMLACWIFFCLLQKAKL